MDADGAEVALSAVKKSPQMVVDQVLYVCEVSRNLQAQLHQSMGGTPSPTPGPVPSLSSKSNASSNDGADGSPSTPGGGSSEKTAPEKFHSVVSEDSVRPHSGVCVCVCSSDIVCVGRHRGSWSTAH